ncbi:MAG: PGRP and LysM peptidoglycan-binding domain-containing protein [Phycisphaerales bacterium]
MGTPYTVQQGDCLSTIAADHGFTSWRTVYEAPENAAFRKLRPDPNLIYPGDVIEIPERESRDEAAPTEQKHTYKSAKPGVMVRIVVRDSVGAPLPYKKFLIRIDGAEPVEGTSGADGLVEARIPPGARSGTLEVWMDNTAERPSFKWPLRLGELDPLETVSGLQQRLNNLGFNPGPIDGIQGPLTTGAVKAFQAAFGLGVDGIVGPQTRGKLKELHGW